MTIASERGEAAPAFTSLGSGRFTTTSLSVEEAATTKGEAGVTLNLVNVPIQQAAKSVLGDLLHLNYVVDDRVQGAVTVQTTNPVSKAALVDVFETVLRSRGAAIVQDAGFHRILPLEDARVRLPNLDRQAAPSPNPGLAIQVVPVDFVSAEEMRGLLEPIAPAGGILKTDARRNLLILSGTASELASMRDTIKLFDVDWMKGMSFALQPLKSSEPEAIVRELDTVFDTSGGPLKDMVRFLPNKRLNAVLVVSPRPQYLQEAQAWISRLDRVGGIREDKLVVYPVHNRPAAELAPI